MTRPRGASMKLTPSATQLETSFIPATAGGGAGGGSVCALSDTAPVMPFVDGDDGQAVPPAAGAPPLPGTPSSMLDSAQDVHKCSDDRGTAGSPPVRGTGAGRGDGGGGDSGGRSGWLEEMEAKQQQRLHRQESPR